MAENISKVRVFRHYDLIVFGVFISILIFASAVGIYRFNVELTQHRDTQYNALSEKISSINSVFEISERSLLALKKFAQSYLTNPEESTLASPKLLQDGERFYLESKTPDIFRARTPLRSNLTGIGKVASLAPSTWHELNMANALTPAYITASENNPSATWFYYLSESKFISIFPWISRYAWQFTENMLYKDYYKKVAASPEKTIWSLPFADDAGKGIKASVGTAVKVNGVVKGILVIDLDLASIKQQLPELVGNEQGFVLFNDQGDVLFHKEAEHADLELNHSWKEVAPSALASMPQHELLQLGKQSVLGEWYLQKFDLPANGWSIVKYQKYDQFSAAVADQFIVLFSLFFIGLIVFLALAFIATRRFFVKPANDLVAHIEHCSRGDLGKIRPHNDWRPWFEIVENIFVVNRKLLQQLTDQNKELDKRVADKTQALQEKSRQHQRDYLLLRSVINAIPEMIIFSDQQGNIVGCNKAFETFIDHQETQLLEKPVDKLLPQPLQQCLSEFFLLPMQQAIAGFSQTVAVDDRSFFVFCTRFSNESGQSLGSITVLHDVTHQYEAQAALTKAKEQAELANQAKSQFLANMSHEIRTPINAISGMMALLENTPLSSIQHHYIDNAQSASGALLHLIDELLDVSRIEAGKLVVCEEPMVLDDIVENALQLNVLAAEKSNLSFTVSITPEVPSNIQSDPLRLTQVLSNLFSNAIKFTHVGGIQLDISLAEQIGDSATIKFDIRDTGIGIALDKQARLFDAFIQADDSMTREYGGSGLGLSICKEIVAQLGGKFELTSEVGRGSCFSFTINTRVLAGAGSTPAINLYSMIELDSACQQVVTENNGQYHLIDSLEMLEQTAPVEQTIVLAIEQAELTQHLQRVLDWAASLEQTKLLLAVCHAYSDKVATQLLSHLEASNISYQLLTKPMYRQKMLKLQRVLTNHFVSIDEQTSVEKASASAPEAPLKGKLAGLNVLLVEDNIVNQMVAEELLLAMGANVVIAEHGQAALDKVQETTFDVVLMDIQMPVMDGLTAARKIRTLDVGKDIPMIAMTAHAREEDKAQSMSAGLDLHIAKPVTAELLCDSVITVVEKFKNQTQATNSSI